MGFSAANIQLWEAVLQLGIISVILIVANILQRKVKPLRNLLLPVAVIGGFLALLLKTTGILPIDGKFMEMLTYHTIALGFIALGLRIPKRCELDVSRKDGVKSGALIVSTYLFQGIIGLIITVVLAMTIFPNLFKAAGILLPMGYGQGPGQAYNIGNTYEIAYGFMGGGSFGLAIAAMGFLWACIGGVIYMNILVKKKKLTLARDMDKKGPASAGIFEEEGEIPMAESVDRLTIQIALVFSIYLLTYLVSLGLTKGLAMIPALSGSANMLSSLVWGFNFIIGSVLALLVRNVFFILRKKKLMTRQYPNNYLLNRIAGFTFDIMVTAGISTIVISDLAGLWIPFIILSMVGGAITLLYLQWICKKLYPGYYYEGFFSMYGMMTGTVSTGILLLREVDPLFNSPATNNLVSGTGYAIILGIPMLALVGYAPKSQATVFITIGIMIVYGLALLAYMLKGGKGKKQKNKVVTDA